MPTDPFVDLFLNSSPLHHRDVVVMCTIHSGMDRSFFSFLLLAPWLVSTAITHQSKPVTSASVVEIEKVFPEFHRCYDTGEAYSAAYLITKEHLLETKTSYNLTWYPPSFNLLPFCLILSEGEL
jgi:hypothetical protein